MERAAEGEIMGDNIFLAVVLFIVGLVFLIKGGDWFVDGATDLAKKFRIPDLLIGATVVSIGTTLPEVMVSATSAFEGHGEIAYGNAIGSVICNASLIAAITITAAPALVKKKELRLPVLFFFLAACFYMGVAYIGGRFDRWSGMVLLAMFVVYMVLTARSAMKDRSNPAEESEDGEEEEEKDLPTWKAVLLLVIGAALIAVGAKFLVENGTIIAKAMGVPEAVIALTFVALGTSLPELVTAITSLIKGHGALSLGNVIGANLFNLVLVSGAAITINPFEVPASRMLAGMNASLLVDIPVMMLVMLLLTVPAMVKGKLTRVQGITLLVIYAAFTVFQFAV